jgi:hypothetical protein
VAWKKQREPLSSPAAANVSGSSAVLPPAPIPQPVATPKKD